MTTYNFLSISVTTDEDSSFWQSEAVLSNVLDYVHFVRDTPFTIHLLGVDYNFIVDSRKLDRSIDDSGNYQETCTISGLSPLVRYAKPRATPITKTWETAQKASEIVEELIGSVTWNLIDWVIPAYRLAADKAMPLDVALQIVNAVGGVIESNPDGSVVCRSKWPISIAKLDTVNPDLTLLENVIYSASESTANDDLINRIRISDETTYQDKMEYVPNKLSDGETDDPRNGILYAFPSPWRDGLRIVTTRSTKIRLGPLTTGTRRIEEGSEDYPPETLTFTEGKSSTSYPVMTVISFEWLDDNLGSLVTTAYSSEVKSSGSGTYGGYSLGKISYTTRYIAVAVTCIDEVENIEAQFLLLETQNG